MHSASHLSQDLAKLCRRSCGVLLLVVGLGVAVVGEAAEPRNGRTDRNPPAAANGFAPAPGISIERATAIARKHTGGRVLSATPKQRSMGTEYRIRMLVDGERVMTVVVDHQGRIKNKR